jgi:hypothetical protein
MDVRAMSHKKIHFLELLQFGRPYTIRLIFGCQIRCLRKRRRLLLRALFWKWVYKIVLIRQWETGMYVV